MASRAPQAAVEQVHRDAHVLVLLKPPGLPTTSSDGSDCLTRHATALDPRAPALHPLSRLDTRVSGLVAFARTREANRMALEARAAGRFERCYVALSAHAPEPAEGEWRWPVAAHPRNPRLRRALDQGESVAGSRDALTRYRVGGQAQGLWALHLWPETGRTHQLRVHAQRAGSAFLGDVVYGGEKRLTLPDGNVLSARRVQLHCGWLRMPHPDAPGGLLELSAPPLSDMESCWQAACGERSALVTGPR